MQKTLIFKKKISIILPVYNEAKNIATVYLELQKSTQSLLSAYDYEIIFVNDGSSDESWSIIQSLCLHSSKIKGINFSCNFGYQRALTAGYDKAQGDAIITMDSDMQHPPYLIPSLLQKWESGANIVYARRTNRDDSFLKKVTALVYYRILETISDVHIPHNVNDFRLIDRKVLNHIKPMREHSRYLRGMIAWAGFQYDIVDFNQPMRLSGTTKYTWTKLFKIAFDGIANFSLFPLKIASFFFIITFISSINLAISIVTQYLFCRVSYNFIDVLYFFIYVSLGLQFLLIWLLGRNIGITYDQLQYRPLYIVREKIKF